MASSTIDMLNIEQYYYHTNQPIPYLTALSIYREQQARIAKINMRIKIREQNEAKSKQYVPSPLSKSFFSVKGEIKQLPQFIKTSDSPFKYSLNLHARSILEENHENMLIPRKPVTYVPSSQVFWSYFMMLNNGHEYHKINFSRMNEFYSNMYRLFYKLRKEFIHTSYYNKLYWYNTWEVIAEICYIICIENEYYIDYYFSGQVILHHAILKIDKLAYGYYNDILSTYINMNGGIVPSLNKSDFFDNLAEYSRPISGLTNKVDDNRVGIPTGIDLSFAL